MRYTIERLQNLSVQALLMAIPLKNIICDRVRDGLNERFLTYDESLRKNTVTEREL